MPTFLYAIDAKFLSLFPSAGKVTKRAAAAEKEAKNQFAVVFKEKNSPD